MTNQQWNARDYEKNSSQQQLWAQELIAKLNLRGNETVLDLGCGDGKVTAEIAAHLPQGSVLGVDLSAEMIALAQQRYPAERFPNLRFQQEDASHLPFRQDFTTVFSNATLHWIHDHRPVLQGIYNSLKPGGSALLQMGGSGNAADIIAVLERQIHSPAWRAWFDAFVFPYGFYGPDEYTGWLKAAGLQPRRVSLIAKDMLHPDKSGLTGWLRTTWFPYTQRVPAEQAGAFLEELVETYLAEHPLDALGQTHVRMVRLEVEALRP